MRSLRITMLAGAVIGLSAAGAASAAQVDLDKSPPQKYPGKTNGTAKRPPPPDEPTIVNDLEDVIVGLPGISKHNKVAVFEVEIAPRSNRWRYQWLFNDRPLDGYEKPQANREKLEVKDLDSSKVGFYRCLVYYSKDDAFAPVAESKEAALMLVQTNATTTPFTLSVTGPYSIQAVSGTTGCPGPYVGYVKYKNTSGSYWWTRQQAGHVKSTLDDTPPGTTGYDSRCVIVNNDQPVPICCDPDKTTCIYFSGATKHSYTVYIKAGAPPKGTAITSTITWE